MGAFSRRHLLSLFYASALSCAVNPLARKAFASVSAPPSERKMSPAEEAYHLFDYANNKNLVHKCDLISKVTGMPTEDVLSIAYHETRFGLYQVPCGIAEIEEDTFYYMVAKYGAEFAGIVKLVEDEVQARKANDSRKTLSPIAKSITDRLARKAATSKIKASAVLERNAPLMETQSDLNVKIDAKACVAKTGKSAGQIKQEILQLRKNHFVCLLFSAQWLEDNRQNTENELTAEGKSAAVKGMGPEYYRYAHIVPNLAKNIVSSSGSSPAIKVVKHENVLNRFEVKPDAPLETFRRRVRNSYLKVREVFTYRLKEAPITDPYLLQIPEKPGKQQNQNNKAEPLAFH